jgi:hypothetical protein
VVNSSSQYGTNFSGCHGPSLRIFIRVKIAVFDNLLVRVGLLLFSLLSGLEVLGCMDLDFFLIRSCIVIRVKIFFFPELC